MKYKIGDYDIKELQNVMLETAKEVDRICKKNNIHYVLTGGTMLGAVRHHGFIPWDDDFDIMMPRDDYKKFIEATRKELSKDYVFECIENNKNYPYNFGKIRDINTVFKEELTAELDINHGVWIDVFPMDYVDTNSLKLKIKLIGKLNALRFAKLGIISGYKYFIVKLIPLDLINWLSSRIMESHLTRKTSSLFMLSMPSPGQIPRNISLFTDVEYIRFEDTKFPIPKDFNMYLTSSYGDYMQYPPLDKQRPGHAIKEIYL